MFMGAFSEYISKHVLNSNSRSGPCNFRDHIDNVICSHTWNIVVYLNIHVTNCTTLVVRLTYVAYYEVQSAETQVTLS